MRTFAYIICLIFTFGELLSQSFLKPNSDVDWAQHEITLNDQDKLSIIRNIMEFHRLPPTPFGSSTDDSYLLSNFHITDVDNDGLTDVLYDGPYGEGYAAIIYQNKGNNIFKSDIIPGKLVEINRSELTGILEFKSYQMSCCGGVWNYLHTTTIVPRANSIEVVIVVQDVYLDATKEPSNFIDKIHFTTINPEYKLRATPKIESTFDQWPEKFDGNTVALYPEGSKGIAIAKETDETGRIWWFVIMENNLNPVKSIMYNNNDPGDTRSLGWMSSRYVKVVQ